MPRQDDLKKITVTSVRINQSSLPFNNNIVNKMTSDTENKIQAVPSSDEPKVNTTNSRLADEITYVFGVSNFAFSAYILGKFPYFYWIWHAIKNSVLLLDRLHKYTKKKEHLYLLEFCYICNYCTFLYTALCLARAYIPGLSVYLEPLARYEATFFQIIFSWSVGVLALAIVFFRNSLVFHSADHTTILAVHISPNLALYGMKWYFKELDTAFPSLFRIGCQVDTCGSASLFDLIVVPAICYLLIWSLPYSLYMFVLGKKTIEENNLIHMYSFMEHNPLWKSWEEKYFHSHGRFAYMSIHFILCTLSYIFAYLSWHSFWFHTLYLIAIVEIALWNGATYYFEVFADRYAASHPKKQKQKYGSI